MKFLEDNFCDKTLLVNIIKEVNTGTPEKYYAIHVMRIDGKRVNYWIKITDNMILLDIEGNPTSWKYLELPHFYEMIFRTSTTKPDEIFARIVVEYVMSDDCIVEIRV